MLDVSDKLTVGTNGKITNVGNDYTIDQDGVTLGDNTQIVMGNNSVITNGDDDYTLDEDGVTLAVPDNNPTTPRAVTWEKDTYDDALIGAYYTGLARDYLALRYDAGAHFFSVEGSSALNIDSQSIRAFRPIKLPLYGSSTRPDASTLEDGSLIYNTDEGKLNYVENGTWTAP